MFRTSFIFLKKRSAGIVGLPNVGKSTLFNALTKSQQAKTGNYPFCTINANKGKVVLYDSRLRDFKKFCGHKDKDMYKYVDIEVDLMDVAGLIEGASKGLGLGNKFLNDIRNCTVLLHSVRCFEDVKNGFEAATPLEDVTVFNNELVLSDLELMEKRVTKSAKVRKSSDPEFQFMQKVLETLEKGISIQEAFIMKADKPLSKREQAWLEEYQLLSSKPLIYVLNVDEDSVVEGNKYSKLMEERFGEKNTCRVSSAIEEQTANLPSREEQLMFLEAYNIKEPRGEVLIRKVYSDLLLLQTFFTIGPQMAHAWTIHEGANIREAAGEIHSDFEKYFVKAKVMNGDKFKDMPNLEAAEMKMTTVDESYIMKDGDVIIVDHNAPRSK